jgi:glucose-6-phosphate isomerase
MRELNDSTLSRIPEFDALRRHADEARQWHLADLFREDTQRAARFTLQTAGLCVDFSKNPLRDDTLDLLTAFAHKRGVEALRDAMFSGQRINSTEDRAALHTVLRLPRDTRFDWEGQELVSQVQLVLDRMEVFSEKIRNGSWRGFSGKPISDVVNIGIGGSDLGPAMCSAALRPYAKSGLTLHFLSNVDGHAISALLDRLNPETTLFIVSSKSFTTQETMLNAQTARAWFLEHGKEQHLPLHFAAVSTNKKAVAEFGIDPDNMFPFWDWVGGRYSIWSAIGLSLVIAIGRENFRSFLAGAYAMDVHFRSAPLEQNMPVILAMIAFWQREFFGSTSQLVAPYHQDLALFPSYLQQLEMESNGKSVTRYGLPVAMRTSPVIWGSAGTNGQHAYFQMLHQGTDRIPVDFIVALKPSHGFTHQHKALLANCFAQAEALMHGNPNTQLPPHRAFPGNHPSNMLLMNELTPSTLGALIALYEHKTFVLGALWDINSFDQWGVELGKTLADRILSELDASAPAGLHDSSTAALITRAKSALN